MACCPNCKRHFREPADEQGDHPCPHCGMSPERWDWICRHEEEDCEPQTLAETLAERSYSHRTTR
jgi:hypothetical protein